MVPLSVNSWHLLAALLVETVSEGSGGWLVEDSDDVEAGDGTIKYTTNGSEPTARSKVWKGARTIDTTTVIRARVFKNGCIPSEILTCTYIIEDRSFDLPVVSIVTDPKNLWNDTIGIYCEGTNGVSGNGVSHAVNWNRDWRRPCNVEIFNNPHDEYITQQCDLSIGGGYSRAYPEKSLELNAEKKYEGKNCSIRLGPIRDISGVRVR